MSAAEQLRPEALSHEERVAVAWRAGRLAWKLDPHQRRVYDKYRAWERDITLVQGVAEREQGRAHSGMRRVFVLDIGRRWGKTFLVCLIKLEDCLRRPGSVHTYATAFFKDIAEIVVPIIDEICEDAPDDCRPEFHRSQGASSQGYAFPNTSRLRLVGIDMNPRGLRGRASDGFAVTEAGFVKGLAKTIGNVVYPQFQRRPWATCILESNAPEDPDHDFDEKFIPDAKKRGAYVFQSIDDNEALTPEQRREFVEATAAITSEADAKREYYGVRFRDPQRYVVPEFDEKRHVGTVRRANYGKAFVAGDPGSVDLFGLLFGYWHFERAQLVIERDWAAANANTGQVAEVIRNAERELWGTVHREPVHQRHKRDPAAAPPLEFEGVRRTNGGLAWKLPFQSFAWWDGQQFQPNPAKRYCDVDKRLVNDMRLDHEIEFVQTTKDNLEAMCNVLRTAFSRGQILIHPECKDLIAHLTAARWDEKRVKWERHPRLGHYDLVAALVYLWRNVDRAADPNPPEHWDRADVLMGHHPGYKQQLASRSASHQIANALDQGRSQWR